MSIEGSIISIVAHHFGVRHCTSHKLARIIPFCVIAHPITLRQSHFSTSLRATYRRGRYERGNPINGRESCFENILIVTISDLPTISFRAIVGGLPRTAFSSARNDVIITLKSCV